MPWRASGPGATPLVRLRVDFGQNATQLGGDLRLLPEQAPQAARPLLAQFPFRLVVPGLPRRDQFVTGDVQFAFHAVRAIRTGAPPHGDDTVADALPRVRGHERHHGGSRGSSEIDQLRVHAGPLYRPPPIGRRTKHQR
ncbi:hypothetical protein ACFQ60_22685 [Streptomyces zhihengii]